MLFDYVDAKEALKNHFTYLTPGNAPYYWIVIGLEVFLYKSAHELSDTPWMIAASFGCFLLVVCTALAARQTCDTDAQIEKTQLRVARIVGVTIPLVSIASVMNRTKFDTALMLLSISVTLAQVITFLFFVKEKNLTKDYSINIPQLLVICSSLVFSTHTTIASLSSNVFLSDIPDDLIVDRAMNEINSLIVEAESSLKHKEKDTSSDVNIDTDIKLPPTQEEKEYIFEKYRKNRIAKVLLDEEYSSLFIPINRITYDLGSEFSYLERIKIDADYIKSAKSIIPNLRILVAFLIAVWVIILLRTVIYANSK
jgi:hypothetical protein